MKNLLIVIGVCFTFGVPAGAQVRQFPYKEKVVVDEAYVRSS